jgi:peptidoglycan hydrolase-like amidase
MGLRLRSGVVMQAVGAELVILDTQAGLYFDLNPTGSLLLSAWLNGADDATAVADVTTRYAATAEQVMADAALLKAELLKRQLVETAA